MRLMSVVKDMLASIQSPGSAAEAQTGQSGGDAVRRQMERDAQAALLAGAVACQDNQIQQSIERFQDAYVLYVQLRDRRSASLTAKILSLLFVHMKDPAFVRASFARAERLLKQAGLKDEVGRMVLMRGQFEADEWERAFKRRDFKTAESSYRDAGDAFKSARKTFQSLCLPKMELETVLAHAEFELRKGSVQSAKRILDDMAKAAKMSNWVEVLQALDEFAAQRSI